MKMRLLLFLSLLVGSVGFSLLSSPNTYALGESYKWIDATTIEGSGGSFGGSIVKDGPGGPSRPVPVGTVRFVRDGTTKTFKAPTTGIYTGNAGGGSGLSISTQCMLQLSITITAINAGSIATNEPGKQQCSNTGLTKALTISDTDKGPKADSIGVPAVTTTGPGAATGETADDSASTCKVDGIGWIICPVVRVMAGLVDGSYAFVSSLLTVQPIMVDDSKGADKSVYLAWSAMRNIANVAFVIAFLIIIISQLTSVGLNNYGIKKMLPRLIVAAILVNSSFWLCAIAVDISNILGSSMNSFMKSMPELGSANTTKFTYDDGQTGQGWAGIAGGVLATTAIVGGVLYATLSALLPALLAALVAIVTVFIVLTIRQALIILLIVISPLAFVAYLLPNTESLFKKWLGLFKTLLLMYPIIAVIFGASALASEIVMTGADGPYKVAIQIMGALISIIPLALTPVVMKTAGGLLNRIGGVVNNPNKGPIDKLRKKAEGYRDYRQDLARGNRLSRGSEVLGKSGGALGGKYSRRRRAAAAITSFGATHKVDADKQKGFAKAVADETGQEYFAKRALNQEGFAEKITGDKDKAVSLQASSQTAVDKLEAESVKAREVLLRAKFDPRDLQNEAAKALEAAIVGKDEVGARAAQNILLNSGAPGLEKLSSVIQKTERDGTLGNEVSASLRKDINGAGLKGRDNALATWSYKSGRLQAISNDVATFEGLSDKELVGQSAANIQTAVNTGVIDSTRAAALLSNDSLGLDFTKAKRAIVATAQNGAPAAAAPTQSAQNIPPQPAQAPTVPPQPTYAPTVQNQAPPAAPGTLNIQHASAPVNANPGNYRTSPPPNTGNFSANNRSAGGIYVPNGTQLPPQQPPSNPPQGPPSNNP